MQPPPHPGRCDSCSLGAQLSGPPSLGCPLGWQGLLQVSPQSSLPLSQVSPEVLQDMGALVWLRQAELLNCVWGQGAAGQFVHQLAPTCHSCWGPGCPLQPFAHSRPRPRWSRLLLPAAGPGQDWPRLSMSPGSGLVPSLRRLTEEGRISFRVQPGADPLPVRAGARARQPVAICQGCLWTGFLCRVGAGLELAGSFKLQGSVAQIVLVEFQAQGWG